MTQQRYMLGVMNANWHSSRNLSMGREGVWRGVIDYSSETEIILGLYELQH